MSNVSGPMTQATPVVDAADFAPRSSQGTRTTELWVLLGSAAFGLALLQGWGSFYTLYPLKPKLYAAMEVMLITATLLVSPRGRVQRVFLPIPMLMFVAWWMASYSWSSFPAGFPKANLEDGVTVVTVMLIGGMLDRRQLGRVLVLSGLAAIGLVFVALVIQPGSAYQAPSLEVGAPGLRGGFIHKTGLASCLLLVASAVSCFEPRRWVRLLCYPTVAVMIVLSKSSAGLATSLTLVVVAWLLNHRDEIVAAVGRGLKSLSILTAIAGVGAIAALLGVITNLVGKDLTFSGRDKVWVGAIEQIQRKPITGWGGNNLYAMIQRDPVLSINRPLGYVAVTSHNAALELMLRLGVVGLALYLIVYVSTVRSGFKLLTRDPPWGRFILMMMVVVTMFAVSEVLTVLGVWFALTCLVGSLSRSGQ
jgi:exopolysaccharide production protein ExoQ